MYKNFDVIVDTTQKSKHNFIMINTNDLKTVKLSIAVNSSKRPIDLTGKTVRIAIVKPDMKTVFQNCSIIEAVNGICEVVLDTQAYLVSGVHVAEVMVYSGTEEVVVTGTFSYSVRKGILAADTLESQNDWQAINQAIADAENILVDLRENGTGVDAQARTDIQTLTSDLAQNAKRGLNENIIDSSMLNVAPKETARPLVTFIDDDGAESVYTRLKPIFESKGVPCTVAIVSDWVGKENVGAQGNLKAMNREQILELQDMGWEVASHEKTHQAMQDVTDYPTLYSEIIQSKSDLLQMGFNVKSIVYPYGQNNSTLTKVAKKVYKIGVATGVSSNDETNKIPLNNFNLRRVGLGSYADIDTLEHHKSVIDKAISEKSWLIFMTHVWAQDSTKDQLISDVIDYTLSQNVEIVTLDKGLETFGDKINIDGAFRITPDNKVLSDIFIPNVKTALNAVTNDTPITFFQEGAVTSSQINSTGATGFPDNAAGVLITDRTYSSSGYQRQIYYVYNSFKKYERYWTTSNTWSNWQKEQQRIDHEVTHDFGSVPAQSSSTLDVTVTGATTPDQVLLTTSGSLPDGLIVTARVSAANTVTLKMFNIKSTNVNSYGNTYRVAVLKNR